MSNQTITFTSDELALLQSLFEVLIEGEGVYAMLRHPTLVAQHRRLYELFTRAYNKSQEG
jgi:hypothetical protein